MANKQQQYICYHNILSSDQQFSYRYTHTNPNLEPLYKCLHFTHGPPRTDNSHIHRFGFYRYVLGLHTPKKQDKTKKTKKNQNKTIKRQTNSKQTQSRE